MIAPMAKASPAETIHFGQPSAKKVVKRAVATCAAAAWSTALAIMITNRCDSISAGRSSVRGRREMK